MRVKILLAFLLVGCMSLMAQKNYQLQSPNRKLQIIVAIGNDIEFSLMREGMEVLAPSTLSMVLENGEVLGANPSVLKVTKGIVDKDIPSPLYEKAEVMEVYNEIMIAFRKDYSIVFRLYDDFLAYRFITREKSVPWYIFEVSENEGQQSVCKQINSQNGL